MVLDSATVVAAEAGFPAADLAAAVAADFRRSSVDCLSPSSKVRSNPGHLAKLRFRAVREYLRD